MKKLLVTLEYPPQVGGIASYVFNFFLHCSNTIIYAPVTEGGDIFDKQNSGIVYRRRPYWFLWPRWLPMLWQIWQIAKKEQIDELYIHHVLPVGYVGYILKKLKKIPYTIFLHGTDVILGTRNASKRREFTRVCSEARCIVVNSAFLKNKLLETITGFLPPIKIIYPCPANYFLTPASPSTCQQLKNQLGLSGKKVILTVARLAPGKGYFHFLKLLPLLLREIPNLVWIIIGDGVQKKKFLDAVAASGIQNVVRFLGKIPYHKVADYYQLADLFVLLTHPDVASEEGWGTVFLEAAASGLPIVAGKVGGVEEAVEHLKTGLVVDIFQEQAVVRAIVELLKNPTYARAMGEAGKERVKHEFRWKRQIEKLFTE